MARAAIIVGAPAIRIALAMAGVFGLLAFFLLSMTAGPSGQAGSASLLSLPTTTTTTAPAGTSSAPHITAQTANVSQSTTSDGLTDCGGVGPFGATGSWTCTFDDEFDGTTLNPNNWTVQTTAASDYTSGGGCYINSPSTVNVSGGTLNLTINKVPTFTCQGIGGATMQSSYTAGSVMSDNHFSQTYGAFEVKAKFPAATVKGLQTSLWLWPDNDTTYGSQWPASGELDIAEWYSEYPTLGIPFIHYNPVGGSDRYDTNDYCAAVNTNEFNTYATVWTPTTITILIDGQTCLVDNWNPRSPEVKPDPFNMPFFINLTSAVGLGTNAPTAQTTFPATSNIDYVRAWSQNS